MSKILTFDEAIADSASCAKRHLLLGNGFSIGCRADIFHYASLYAEADFSKIPEAKAVFEALDTKDFEVAIKALESSSKLLPIYAPIDATTVKKMRAHANALKDVLVTTIAGNHPDLPSSIAEEKFWACRKFLNNFLGPENDGQVYTLNYDLLLYWTLMHEDMPFDENFNLAKNDGFGNDEDDPNADYVVWQGETASHSARVHFLHGALHLFDAGSELKKYTWIRNGTPLIVQARDAMNANAFPLFVAEGTSVQKKDKIRHNAYLYQCFKQFTANAAVGTHCFFIFGHSLAENDDHILTRLGRGRFKKLYVGLFGDPASPYNEEIAKRARGLSALRQDRYPLEVIFYDSATASVWATS
ncbi:DUF4917 family protein [Tardiphaga sp. 803_E3_N1_3]|uniref:DUF4917 family protein n=1 Tax=unclassified Tardiphaga TaxID=2631404 RepID=UPI003F271640